MSANEREFLDRIGASAPQWTGEPPEQEPNGAPPQPAPPPAVPVAVKFSQDATDTGPIPVQHGGAHRLGEAEPAGQGRDGVGLGGGRDRVPLRQQPVGQAEQRSSPVGQAEPHTGWAGGAPEEDYRQDGVAEAAAAPGWAASATTTVGARRSPRGNLKANDLVRSRTVEPSRGWRKWLCKASFGAINVGQSADEIELRRLTAAIKSPLGGAHSVTVVGGKGGAGKTSLTCAIASVFADERKKDLVVALDADPTQAANLPDRIAPEASATFGDVIAGKQVERNADLRTFVGQNIESGLDVLAGPARADWTGRLDADTYTRAHQRLQLYYDLLLTDTAVDFGHPVMAGVLGRTDALVLIASAVPEGLAGAWIALEWLEQAGYERFMSRMVLVINHIRMFENRRDRKETSRRVADIRDKFGDRMAPERIFELPYDSHIAEAGVLELNRLAPKTYRELLRIAAAIGSGFGGDGRRR